MIKRLLAGALGALIFAILTPIAWFLIFDAFPFGELKGAALLVGGGALFGAVLGALFPKVFGFVFELFLTDV